MSNDHDPSWLDEDTVTPEDIRLAIKDAVAAGGNRRMLDRKLKAAIEEAGGTIEDLAQQWTRRNRNERLMAEYRAQLNRRVQP
ncbi:hypothetical protein [Nonomuraea sp. NPDC049400]|uniref:hypothetical protein n=1 Tax=Nonomuraea sp. NPDC049400 TaxID=3364352 RepID=UPI0037985F15